MNPITRKEMFLAAAGGQDVPTPTPITREEVFLNEIAKGGGGSSLPSTETASAGDVLSLDDNKEPQWATPSGGGGVLAVHSVDGTLDKTWQEIVNAMASGGAANVFVSNEEILGVQVITNAYYNPEEGERHYIVKIGMVTYTSTTANGYPMAN